MNAATELVIRRATQADRDGVVAALTEGFSADPINCWIFDNPATYHRYASGYFSCYTDYCLKHGYVFIAGDVVAATIGMPLDALRRLESDIEFDAKLEKMCGPHFVRVSAMNQVMAEHHPNSPNHMYSVFTGVMPSHQNLGLGARLVHAVFDLIDEQNLPMYAEAGNENNARLWTRIGFSLVGHPLPLPDSDLMLHPIWRPAKVSVESAIAQ
ncbi:GNAT family N-acetyltransferase [Dyella flagellata]|uniref:N-acetyltransferase domain-containing protein n=1 Tax=Dyella flagellata TaxID=1867833 RepID=A0ABQ5X6M5_9GAMM|nr:GNAT family N-acetyltransferase [Dyella flagellata]GLQ86859.1 hypothetical protein GCM10007898_04250 [Dyella flagellata]